MSVCSSAAVIAAFLATCVELPFLGTSSDRGAASGTKASPILSPEPGVAVLPCSSTKRTRKVVGFPALACWSPSPRHTVRSRSGCVLVSFIDAGEPRTCMPSIVTCTSLVPEYLERSESVYVPSLLSTTLVVTFLSRHLHSTLPPPRSHKFAHLSAVFMLKRHPNDSLRPTMPRSGSAHTGSSVDCACAAPGLTSSANGEPLRGRTWLRRRTWSR